MIIVKGDEVSFVRADSARAIRLPATYKMVHDPDGESLPKCEVYFGPVTMTRAKAKMTSAASQYLGRKYEGRLARLNPPSGGWKPAAQVSMIHYRRWGHRGVDGPREMFKHPFKGSPLTLERSGRFYRIALGRICFLDDRGFVFP